jgi:hypothetical protein
MEAFEGAPFGALSDKNTGEIPVKKKTVFQPA